ncbi:MAG: nucleoside hydrolase [Solirubrobacterales bacterium]|nr:nucleoside hydrolase [Solirubrobacterales bacterium]
MRFLLDCDPGHDDMLAILLAAQHLDVVAITTVSGNQSLPKVTANALKILELAGLQEIPVAAGLARPLVAEARHAPEIHGESGLDGAELPEPRRAPIEEHAIDVILQASRRHDDLVLVATGPLSNVAAALVRDPPLAQRLVEISLMGGSTATGNATPAAEFNISCDPEAADVVFRSGVPLRMFGLNVTHQVVATAVEVARIRELGGRLARTVADLIEFVRAANERVFGASGAALHDPLAVATFIAPELIELREMHVAVELHGALTRGMTVCDDRRRGRAGDRIAGREGVARGAPPNCRVGVRADAPGFFDLLVETLARY